MIKSYVYIVEKVCFIDCELLSIHKTIEGAIEKAQTEYDNFLDITGNTPIPMIKDSNNNYVLGDTDESYFLVRRIKLEK